MKNCPYCAEEIQDAAAKCKHCGEWLRTGTPCTPANVRAADTASSDRRPSHPSQDTPSVIKGIQVFEDHLVQGNRVHMFHDIMHLKYEGFQQKMTFTYAAPGFTTGQNAKLTITFKSQEVLSIKGNSAFGLGSKSLSTLSNVAEFIHTRTFTQRYNQYVERINHSGYFIYDNTKFYADGKVVTRKGKVVHISDYSVYDGGTFIQLAQKSRSAFSRAINSLANRHPNTNFWKSVIHSEFTINTSVDRDVFNALMWNMYKIA